MEIKNAADQDRAYKAEFPELPMQWKIMDMRLRKSLAKGFPEVYINW